MYLPFTIVRLLEAIKLVYCTGLYIEAGCEEDKAVDGEEEVVARRDFLVFMTIVRTRYTLPPFQTKNTLHSEANHELNKLISNTINVV